jgi:tripartite-type tricarboxylate transporter receptor subunit TctC
MKFIRARSVRHYAWAAMIPVLVAVTIPAVSMRTAHAAGTYPAETIRVVVPFGVGGLADITMRLVAKQMNLKFGDNVIIDNRPGAGGIAAASAVLSAPRDGYTVALFANGTAIAESLFKLPFNPEKDFVPVSSIAYFDLLILAKGGGLKTVNDVIALAHKRQITMGSINPGSTQNLSTELFKSTAKLNAVVVPYRTTGDVVSGLVRGDLDIGFESYAAVKGSIAAGQIQALAATGASRSAWLPNLPTVAQAGIPDYQVTGWNAMYVAKGTPQAIVDTLNRQLNVVLADPGLKAQLRNLGTEPQGSTPEQMAKIFRDDASKWGAVIAHAGIKPQ